MSAIESRGRPAERGATRPPSGSSRSRRRSPPTTSGPPLTADRSTSEKTRSRRPSRRWSGRAILPLRWHLVGHLQSNKARKAASVFDVVHSVDSAALAARLDEAAAASTRRLDWLIQVDLAGEATKHGASAADVVTICERAASLANARLAGLMILPPAVDNPVQARPYFRALRELQGRARRTRRGSAYAGPAVHGHEPRFRGGRGGRRHHGARRNRDFWEPKSCLTRRCRQKRIEPIRNSKNAITDVPQAGAHPRGTTP